MAREGWTSNFGGILNNHVDDIDWQHNNDQQGTTITADVNSTVKLIEVSHGEHQTQNGPAEGQGYKVDAAGISHVAVDHADCNGGRGQPSWLHHSQSCLLARTCAYRIGSRLLTCRRGRLEGL